MDLAHTALPLKADSPLVVDADTVLTPVLTPAVASQRFKSIAGQRKQYL